MLKREVIIPKQSAEDDLQEIEKRWRKTTQPTTVAPIGMTMTVIVFCTAYFLIGTLFGC